MSRRRPFPVVGTALVTMMVMLGGAKISFLPPLDDDSRAALASLGAAMAAESNEPATDVPDTPLEIPQGGARLATEDVAVEGPPTELLRAIALERALLGEQQHALAVERAEIALGREMLSEETNRLSELRTVIEALLARAETQHTADITQLAELYRNMKPADAANIMADMDLQVTVNVIVGMSERDAAAIMARLPLEVSRAVSRILLERSKLPGDQTPVTVRLPNL